MHQDRRCPCYRNRASKTTWYNLSDTDLKPGSGLFRISHKGAYSMKISVDRDHGWQLGEHGEWGKYSVFQRATRVPLLLRGPGVPPGEESGWLVELVDVMPSVAELALGVRVPSCGRRGQRLCSQGASFARQLRGSVGKGSVFWQYPRPSIRPQQDSDEPSLRHVRFMGYSVRTTSFRYTAWRRFSHK